MKKFLILFCIFTFFNCAKASQDIHVVYTIDNNYPVYTLISIDSAIKNNTTNSNLYFYIIEDNLTDKNIRMMKEFILKRNQHVKFIHIDMAKIDNNKNYYTNIERISRIAMARILIPDILPNTVKRVIYLDADTLVATDLLNLYNYNLKGYTTGMVCDSTTLNGFTTKNNILFFDKESSCKIINPKLHDNYNTIHNFSNGYYNSGVILMDLDKWRKQKISQQMVDYLNKHKNYFAKRKNKYDRTKLFGDQDLINIVLEKKIKTLPTKWNNQVIVDYNPYIVPSVIHFIGPKKPWNVIYYSKATSIYLKYWISSPLIIYIPQNLVKLYCRHFNLLITRKKERFLSTYNNTISLRFDLLNFLLDYVQYY